MSPDVEPKPSGGFEWTQEPWGAALRCSPLAERAPHLFTVGNLRLRDSEDEWSAVAARIGVAPGSLRLIRQVHGVGLAVVRAGGAVRWDPPAADIVISDDPDAAIAVRVADCAPILMADRGRGVVAAVHAGWRGTARGAVMVAVAEMRRVFGCDPAGLVAAIGPCLGPCCGEVGQDVVDAFRAAGHPARHLERWIAPGESGRSHVDLWAANRDQLEAAGVPAGRIFTAALCTKTHMTVMHSYRAHGPGAGRMIGVIRARAG